MTVITQKDKSLIASTAVPPKEPKSEPAKPLTKEEKLKAVASAAASLNKTYETKLVQKLGKGKAVARIPSTPTRLLTVDEDVIQCGGMPRGRIIEIYGPESAGKTAISLHIIAQAQKSGGLAAMVDAEHALDPRFAKVLGVNIDELVISQPDYGEQALEVVLALAETGAIDVILVDSVSALVPKAELEGDMGDSHMGLQARLMSQAMRKLVGVSHKLGTTIIFINQVREKIGVVYGNPEVTTGGRALKFYASVRLEVRRLSKTDGGEIIDPETSHHIGHRMKIKAVKNKVGSPFRETFVNLMYASGFDLKADTLNYSLEHDLVIVGDKTKEKEGNGVPKGWYSFENENYRKDQLTEDAIFDRIALSAKKAIDAKIAASQIQNS